MQIMLGWGVPPRHPLRRGALGSLIQGLWNVTLNAPRVWPGHFQGPPEWCNELVGGALSVTACHFNVCPGVSDPMWGATNWSREHWGTVHPWRALGWARRLLGLVWAGRCHLLVLSPTLFSNDSTMISHYFHMLAATGT